MSTILKALRRLEDERETEVHDLRGQVLARPPDRPARPRLPLLVASGAVGAVLVVGGFVLLEGRVNPWRSEDSPSLASSDVPPSVASSNVPPSVASSNVPPAVAAPRWAALPPTRGAAPASPPARGGIGADGDTAPAAGRPRPAGAVVTARPPAPRPRSSASVSAAPPSVAPPPPAARPTEPAPPAIASQPEVARRAPVPGVVVERTLWHPKPARRVAFLHVEGRPGIVELHEGDAVGDSVVQEIAPSAVIFLHRGVEIRRRVGAKD